MWTWCRSHHPRRTERPNYHEPRCRGRLTNGLVITIEPIIAAGMGGHCEYRWKSGNCAYRYPDPERRTSSCRPWTRRILPGRNRLCRKPRVSTSALTVVVDEEQDTIAGT